MYAILLESHVKLHSCMSMTISNECGEDVARPIPCTTCAGEKMIEKRVIKHPHEVWHHDKTVSIVDLSRSS